jgi:DNA-binding LytR/AlgR family response regulator
MNVVIIEDEKLAVEKLESMLLETDSRIRVIARLGSVKESVSWLMQHSADLIFLDIQLSDGISFSIFDQVAVTTPVIFTTAYDQYAIKAFQLNSISYLLKPIRKSELEESLRKLNSLKSAFTIDFDALLSQLKGEGTAAYKKRFLIQIGEKIKKIETAEVAYFYVMEKGTYLRTFTGNNLPLDTSLDKLELQLDPACFFRINRKYLVNMEAIVQMTAWSRSRIKLELKPPADHEFDSIVSVDRSAVFRNWLNG